MKEKLTRNLGLKLLSLFMAILTWLIILNIADPVKERSFNDIEVTIINENALAQKDKVYEVVSGNTVNVTVRAKRSVLESLNKSDVKAVADLSELSVVNAAEIKVTVPGHERDIIDKTQNISTMKVSLENLKTEQFRINVVADGEVASGYYVKEKLASPNIIQVSGAETVINKIKEVVVEVDVSGKRQSFTDTAVPKVYDNNGTLMDSDKLNLSVKEVEVTVNLLQTKTVRLYIEVAGKPYPGYNVEIDYEPKQVVIAGEKDELDKVPVIYGEYNISNQREDMEDQVNIADFITKDVILIDENQTAAIKVKIEKMDSKDLSYDSSEIELRNIPNGLAAKTGTPNMHVILYGNREYLNMLSKYNLKPYIDLKGAKVGTDYFNVGLDLPDGVTLDPLSVMVSVSGAGT
ncbi:MAG: hypothetical protein K0R05_1128 [Anaerocolumna sp.]|jgi:YbbR domain-containing protein|nr:hypothetical protein [Anaerocolumna sp.]